ncbi:MAG: DUF934 domain-containing protein [Pseudomonadales bacterium]
MTALIEIDSVSGSLQGGTSGPRDIALLSAAEWHAHPARQTQGLLLGVDAEPDERFLAAPLIGIEFPAFHDGRGLSLAVLLRSRLGYAGELRAVGDVQPDLIHYYRRCGFDSFVLPKGRSVAPGSAILAPYSDYYQASVRNPRPLFRRNRGGVHQRDR